MQNIQFIVDTQSFSTWQQGEQTVVGVGFVSSQPFGPCAVTHYTDDTDARFLDTNDVLGHPLRASPSWALHIPC